LDDQNVQQFALEGGTYGSAWFFDDLHERMRFVRKQGRRNTTQDFGGKTK
jgi:hypothetical protein